MARTVLQATGDIMEAALNQTEKELEAYEEDPYDLGLQIGGVFIIMAASIAGMVTSYLFGSDADCDRKSALYLILTLMRGVGVGVIICTALIHLIGEAYEPFEDAGMSEIYEQWPMVFAMVGMFLMAILEFVHHRLEFRSRHYVASAAEVEHPDATLPAEGMPAEVTLNPLQGDGAHHESDKEVVTKSVASKQRSAVLVELSILIHSVLIGFDLGLQTKSQWVPLVIAITFHQFFEGFAVGQIVLDAQFTFWKKFAMTAFYSLTTSVGIAIGIATYLGQK